jgi:hypothetical protein
MSLQYQTETRTRDEIAQQANPTGFPGTTTVPLNTPIPSPTAVLNNAQQGALDSIKASPVSDPALLKETASQAIGDNVSNFQTQIQSIQKRQDELMNQLLGFFNQTDNEKNLTTKLNNLDTSYETG